MSGTLTAGSLSVAGISSSGALIGPYVTATSSTATSTFGGAITGPSNFTVQSSSGYVGIGTSTPASALNLYGDVNVSRELEVHNYYASGARIYTHSVTCSPRRPHG